MFALRRRAGDAPAPLLEVRGVPAGPTALPPSSCALHVKVALLAGWEGMNNSSPAHRADFASVSCLVGILYV